MMIPRDVQSVDDAGSTAGRHVDFGLSIGVDHYPRFRSLNGAVADAQRFHAWLCEPDGGGLNPDDTRLVLSSAEPPVPLQLQVDDAIVELLGRAAQHGRCRRLYLHFSGHGAANPNAPSDVALLLAAWSKVMARVALSHTSYCDELGALGRFDEITVFLDCCRSVGEHAIGVGPAFTLKRFTPPTTRTFVAYATEAGCSAFETEGAGGWKGVFTTALLAILRRSLHGITADDLKRELEREVAMRGQRAHVTNGLEADSRFGRRGTLPRLEIRFRTARGRVWLSDGRGERVADREASEEPWILFLSAGIYVLEQAAGPRHEIDHGRDEVTHVAY